METEPPVSATGHAPADLLAELDADRRDLAGRLEGHPWLAVGFGLVAAAYVAAPAVPAGGPRTAVLVGALVASVLLLARYRRETGVRLAGLGGRAVGVLAATVALTLGLLSVSFGLAAADLRGWIALCAGVAFAVVRRLVVAFVRAVAGHLAHAR